MNQTFMNTRCIGNGANVDVWKAHFPHYEVSVEVNGRCLALHPKPNELALPTGVERCCLRLWGANGTIGLDGVA